MDTKRERAEKQLVDYQEKWVPQDTQTTSWCNPWSFTTSVSFNLARSNRPAETQRTPRKNNPPDIALLRKSPRLLSKNDPPTRRTPVKKAVATAAAATTGPLSKMDAKIAFKSKLKVVIIKVLSEQQINVKDALFRTCANKLSVICTSLLKDTQPTASSRQMYQVAKSHVKQIVQFVKGK